MKGKWREQLVWIESIVAKTRNIHGEIWGGLESIEEIRAFCRNALRYMLCSAEVCRVLSHSLCTWRGYSALRF